MKLCSKEGGKMGRLLEIKDQLNDFPDGHVLDWKEEIDWLINNIEENEGFMKDLVSKLDYTLSLVVKRHNEYVNLQEENKSLSKTLKDANEYYVEIDKKIGRYEKALNLLRYNYDLPEEPTDLIPVDVLYEIQLIVKKALGE
jgi:uncharacterized coiled-coil DUF342 family protein